MEKCAKRGALQYVQFAKYYQGDDEEDEDEMGGVYRRNGKENHMGVHCVHVRGEAHQEAVDTTV